jgi:hypothetical protein
MIPALGVGLGRLAGLLGTSQAGRTGHDMDQELMNGRQPTRATDDRPREAVGLL